MSISKGNESSGAITAPATGKVALAGNIRTFAKWGWLAVALADLWFHAIDNLRLEWETNPQYSYGLVVPILIAGLLLRRWQRFSGRLEASPETPWWGLAGLCGCLCFLYLPTRLIEEATPEWRPLQWVLAIETVGLTLYAVYIAGGKNWLRVTTFPILFFLLAVPWPSPIENPIIQGLSRINATGVVNVLFCLGVPATQHGNLVEVSTGMVGINDACSGIRSLQSSLMVSLFIGEYFFFSWRRRLLLVPAGITLALLLNLCRTSLLTWLAAKKGIDAVSEYHDEAGFTILMICTALLWSVGWLLSRIKSRSAAAKTGAIANPGTPPLNHEANQRRWRRITRLGVIMAVWFLSVETGVALWYQIRESHIKPGPSWTVKLPENNPTYKTLPFTEAEHELLRFDQGEQGEWQEPDGTDWSVYYYNWLPGRVAGYLAKRHTPDICLTATGYKMTDGPELNLLEVNGILLPMRHYVFSSSSGPLQVYQCHWEAGADKDTYTANESSRFNLIRSVWAGRGNKGQKVLEVIISGYNNAADAKQALVRQLQNMIVVQNQASTASSNKSPQLAKH